MKWTLLFFLLVSGSASGQEICPEYIKLPVSYACNDPIWYDDVVDTGKRQICNCPEKLECFVSLMEDEDRQMQYIYRCEREFRDGLLLRK